MPLTPPGSEIWENSVNLVIGGSPYVTGFYDTTGYTDLLVSAEITNGSGTTTFTIEGSFDGSTLDSTMPYTPAITATNAPAGAVYVVQHPYVRFRVVIATASGTVSTFNVKSRA